MCNYRWRPTLLVALVVAFLIIALPPPSLAADSRVSPAAPVTHYRLFNCTHAVRFGETLSMLAVRYHTTVLELMRANFIVNPNLIFAGRVLRVPCVANAAAASCVRTSHIVQSGDTLIHIGLRFGVNYLRLAFFNGITNPNLIFMGMRLAIPCSTASPSPVTGSLSVAMQNTAFQPGTLNIHVGQTVMWRNNEASLIPHTTTSGTCAGGVCTANGTWDSPQLNPGGTFSHTFGVAGTFTYYCRMHGSAMQGTIVVSP